MRRICGSAVTSTRRWRCMPGVRWYQGREDKRIECPWSNFQYVFCAARGQERGNRQFGQSTMIEEIMERREAYKAEISRTHCSHGPYKYSAQVSGACIAVPDYFAIDLPERSFMMHRYSTLSAPWRLCLLLLMRRRRRQWAHTCTLRIDRYTRAQIRREETVLCSQSVYALSEGGLPCSIIDYTACPLRY